MKWILIRHGKTQGNIEQRYIGCRTDESLCSQGVESLKEKEYPAVQRVFVSPMKRCRETAELIYPGVPAEMIDDFRECDFGEFENKNYAEAVLYQESAQRRGGVYRRSDKQVCSVYG